jgi:hypothetical protein
MRRRSNAGSYLFCFLVILGAACSCDRNESPQAVPAELPRPGPTTARWQLVETLRNDLNARRHPADGGGQAWLDAEPGRPPVARAGMPGRWTIVYEAGPLGVAAGGMVFLQVSPFWGWSTPQVTEPGAPGYTEVTTAAAAVELKPRTLDQQLLGIEVAGRELREGEQIRIIYGAGAAGAVADRYAERSSRFWIAVDGDGDGVRKLLEDSPAVDVAPRSAARLVLTLPTTARPGATVRLTVAVLDAVGNAGVEVEGDVVLKDPPAGLELPGTIALAAGDKGRRSVEGIARREGVYRLHAEGPAGLEAESNPLIVTPQVPRVLWGDLHGHSNFSDGTGTPEDYFFYARDVAALDVAALTDHDHWGMLFLDQHPAMWEEIRRQTRRFHRPGRFVTLLGFEWTSWIYGHRHVLYFTDAGNLLSSLDPAYESPQRLWAALRGQPALTFAHHSAGGPIATDWSIAPDPVLEPLTEVVSVHGSSEAADVPSRVYAAVSGNFVRDALERSYRLGFVGSGDGHDGHPGLTHLAAPSGGVAAIFSEELTREGVLAALSARRTYATNGPRIFLQVKLGGQPMGTTTGAGDKTLAVHAAGTAPITAVDVIRSGSVVERVPGNATEISFERAIGQLRGGEYLYVRVIQESGGLAWSSPFFVE